VGVEKPVGGNRSMKSNGCESCPAKASERAGGECCHSRGCEAYTAKEAGREGSAPKSYNVAMPAPSQQRKAASENDRNCEGRPGIGGVASSGHVSGSERHHQQQQSQEQHAKKLWRANDYVWVSMLLSSSHSLPQPWQVHPCFFTGTGTPTYADP